MNERKSKFKSVTVYKNWVDVIEDSFSDDDAGKGRMYSAIMNYSLYGDIPKLTNKWEMALFRSYIPNIETSNSRRLNGEKGGKQNASKPEAKRKQNASNVKEKENENVNEKENIYVEESSARAQEQYPQTLEELQEILESNTVSNKKMTLTNIQSMIEKYFFSRMGTDWVKVNGKKVNPDTIPYDFVHWCASEDPEIEEVKLKAMGNGKEKREKGF